MQEVGESFDIVYDGKFFQELWEYEKRKHTFNWNNRTSKHDAFQVKDFGASMSAVTKPTSREQDAELAMKMKIE